MKKFISLHIYKWDGCSFSNKGLSEKSNTCYIETNEGNLAEEDIDSDLIVTLRTGLFGTLYLEPVKPVQSGSVGYMFGGCYVSSSDARFDRLVRNFTGNKNIFAGALPLHDRCESTEEYASYSN